jgi:hypothetical protein
MKEGPGSEEAVLMGGMKTDPVVDRGIRGTAGQGRSLKKGLFV